MLKGDKVIIIETNQPGIVKRIEPGKYGSVYLICIGSITIKNKYYLKPVEMPKYIACHLHELEKVY